MLSHMLFNMVREKIMHLVEEEMPDRCGCVIEGKHLWNLQYADYITLIPTSKEELEKQESAVKRHSESFGLIFNEAKINVLALN